jgi:RNA polymerase sigma-70 factor (ECF subfamily)
MKGSGETALLERCLEGDREALAELFQNYEKRIFNVGLRITGSRADAADVTQTVFMKVFENLHQFDPEYRFFSWIYRIAVNESIQSAERSKRGQPLDGLEPSSDRDPQSEVEAQDLMDSVQSGLMGLGARYRTLVVLKHFQGFSYREISKILQLPETVVKSRLYRARQMMKDFLTSRNAV